MKFSLKRMLGLLALGGAVAYVQKKKGLKNAGQSLKEMFQNKLGNKQEPASMGMRDTGMSGVRSGLAPSEPVGGFDDEPRGGFGEDITRRPI